MPRTSMMRALLLALAAAEIDGGIVQHRGHAMHAKATPFDPLLDTVNEEVTGMLGEDILSKVEYADPYSYTPMSFIENNMRTTAMAVSHKAALATEKFKQHYAHTLQVANKAGFLQTEDMRQIDIHAKAQLASMIQTMSEKALADESFNATEIFENYKYGIVRLQNTVCSRDPLTPESEDQSAECAQFVGSGFVVLNNASMPSPELGPVMFTNAHVTANSAALTIQFPALSAQTYEATAVLVNVDWDLSIVRLTAESKQQLDATLADEKKEVDVLHLHDPPSVNVAQIEAATGSEVISLGFPLGQNSIAESLGIISGSDTISGMLVHQSTAAISPGNSGGPLFDKNSGKVVGVNFAASGQENAQNVNYAIPSHRVFWVLNEYRNAAGGGGGLLETGAAFVQPTFDPKTCNRDAKDNSFPGCHHMLTPQLEGTATTVVGNVDERRSVGCGGDDQVGVILGRVADHSMLQANADVKLQALDVITKVDGQQLDKFGQLDDETFGTKASWHQVLYDNRADEKAADPELTFCRAGKEMKTKLSLAMNEKDVPAIPNQPEADLVREGFVMMGDVTMIAANVALMNALIQVAGKYDLFKYLLNADAKAQLIIVQTHADDEEMLGCTVGKINGEPVGSEHDTQGDLLAAVQKLLQTGPDDFHVLQTNCGQLKVGKKCHMCEQTFKKFSKSESKGWQAGVDHCKDCPGCTFAESSLVEADAAQVTHVQLKEHYPEMPIEARNVQRGGFSRKLSPLDYINALVPPSQQRRIAMAAKAMFGEHKGKKQVQSNAFVQLSPGRHIGNETDGKWVQQELQNIDPFAGLVDHSVPTALDY